MAGYPDSVPLGGFIAPNDTLDTYPTQDSRFTKGGHHEVADITARNNIPTKRRREGMVCYIASTQVTYQLIGGLGDANWQTLPGGPPSGVAGGDLYGTYPNPGVQRVTNIYNCTATEQVGDAVFLNPATSQANQANATALATMPAAGLIESKPTPTTCLVVHSGIANVPFAVLFGVIYFVDVVAGGIVTPFPPAGIIQQLCTGIGANSVLVNPMLIIE